jgi:hypothetical protein
MMTRNPLIYAASIAVLVGAGAVWRVATVTASALHHVSAAADAWAAAPALLAARVTDLQGSVDALPGKVMPPVLKVVDTARRDVVTRADAQITALRGDVMTRVDKIEADANGRTGEALAIVAGIRQDAVPVLTSSARLMNTYAAVPAQLGAELRPSWRAIQPEITCRQADGSGYGGCWHSRITGLMGEALKVGGVFTKHFPSMVASVDGIGVDVHSMTTAADHRFFNPGPKTKKQKFEAAGKLIIGLGTAGLRGGVF